MKGSGSYIERMRDLLERLALCVSFVSMQVYYHNSSGSQKNFLLFSTFSRVLALVSEKNLSLFRVCFYYCINKVYKKRDLYSFLREGKRILSIYYYTIFAFCLFFVVYSLLTIREML